MTQTLTAYCGPAPLPGQLWQSWNLDPVLLAVLGLFTTVVLYSSAPARRLHACLAVAVLIIAFISPLCALTVALFSARAVHHLVLITVAAPLLALAVPLWPKSSPSLSLGALSAAMIAWHVPGIYDAIWASHTLYWLMQGAMLLPAWLFWSAVLAPQFGAEEAMRRALLIGGLAGIMGFLGAILTFAPAILYVSHIDGAMAWGMAPLADQQLAGLVMWVPGFVPVAVLAAWMLVQGWRRGFAA